MCFISRKPNNGTRPFIEARGALGPRAIVAGADGLRSSDSQGNNLAR
jgi:hypothetical protein